jgi:hypothetical protein
MLLNEWRRETWLFACRLCRWFETLEIATNELSLELVYSQFADEERRVSVGAFAALCTHTLSAMNDYVG